MDMENAARKLHKYKPVLLAMGLTAMLTGVSDEQQLEYDPFLKVSGDEREAQVLYNYDRLFGLIKDGIDKHNLEPPLLFLKGHIDRTSLTYWNKDQVNFQS